MEHCNTVSLYTIKLMMIIQGTIELRYNIRSGWFLDIRIFIVVIIKLCCNHFCPCMSTCSSSCNCKINIGTVHHWPEVIDVRTCVCTCIC